MINLSFHLKELEDILSFSYMEGIQIRLTFRLRNVAYNNCLQTTRLELIGAFGGCFSFWRPILVQQHRLVVKGSLDTTMSFSIKSNEDPMRNQEEKTRLFSLASGKA